MDFQEDPQAWRFFIAAAAIATLLIFFMVK